VDDPEFTGSPTANGAIAVKCPLWQHHQMKECQTNYSGACCLMQANKQTVF